MNIAFVTVHVKDLEESARFYQEVLGLTVASRFAGGPGTEIAFLQDEEGHQLELISTAGESPADQPGGRVTIGFGVPDMDEALRVVKSRGAEIHRGPIQVPSGAKLAFLFDPNGVEIELFERKR